MKKEHYIQLLLLIVVLTGISYVYFYSGRSTFLTTKHKVEKEIGYIYETFYDIVDKDNFDIKSLNSKEFLTLNKDLPFYLYIYENDELVFWNSNRSVPDLNVNFLGERTKLVSLKNAYYLAIKKEKGNRTYIALSLIRNSYTLVNKYLNNSYSDQFPFNNDDVILPALHSKGESINCPRGNVLFRVQKGEKSEEIDKIKLFVSIIVYIFIYIFFFLISYNAYKNYSVSLSLFISLMLGILWHFSFIHIPFEFKKLLLFDSKIYGSELFSSLGSLLILAIVVFSLFYHFMAVVLKNKLEINYKFKIILILTSPIFFVIRALIIRSLVLDSIVNFEAQNFALLNIYTIIGLILAVIISTSYVFFIVAIAHNNKLEKKEFVLILISTIFTFIFLYLKDFNGLAYFLTALYFILFILLFWYKRALKLANIFKVITTSLFFAVFFVSSILVVYSSTKTDNHKQTIANSVSRQQDFWAEDLFNKIENKIKKDNFIKQFYIDPMVSYTELNRSITYNYFGGYYSKFNVTISPLSIGGIPIRHNFNKTIDDYNFQIKNFGHPTVSQKLYYIQNKERNYYISILQIYKKDILIGNLALEISPKTYEIGNVYPELLLEGKNKPITQHEIDFDYATYIDNKLVSFSGDFAFPNIFNDYFDDDKNSNFVHYVQKINEHKKVIITTKKVSIFDKFSVFSFILSISTIFAYCVIIVFLIFAPKEDIRVFNFLSFRNKISISMLSLVILSFVIIGIATVSYFSKEFNTYHRKRLVRKKNAITTSMNYVIEKHNIETPKQLNSHFNSSLNNDLAEISNIHKMDINLFDMKGKLLISSQDGIFTSGLLSNKINHNAYVSLFNDHNNQLVQDERIDKLKYLAIYVPIYGIGGSIISYMNVPYFSKEKNLRKDISNFMISLINVYVLLFLIGSIVAFYISNSITKPLKKISESLKHVSLSKKNEPIYWEIDDEIGGLVKVYNKMIIQLEQSANLLAKNERDEAWREMAKQIAHEIKNPLTPMKLSIQHLQRAIKDDPERAIGLAERVSKTMLEQINNLTDIATAFSSFTKMPAANNEIIQLDDILNTTIDLFTAETFIIKDFKITTAKIFADKNQLMSVFNNLVKNAIQATEDSENPNIKVSLIENIAFYLVKVEDNGYGISEEKRKKVFVPNFTTKSSGTGLGLAISKQIIENMNGKIWFDSKIGVHTTFFVEIPKHV